MFLFSKWKDNKWAQSTNLVSFYQLDKRIYQCWTMNMVLFNFFYRKNVSKSYITCQPVSIYILTKTCPETVTRGWINLNVEIAEWFNDCYIYWVTTGQNDIIPTCDIQVYRGVNTYYFKCFLVIMVSVFYQVYSCSMAGVMIKV